METKPTIAFFGGEPLGLPALQALVAAGLTPALVVCNPDRKAGRGHTLQSPRIKTWAVEHAIPVFQPTSYKKGEHLVPLQAELYDLFVVVAYNFILPAWLIKLPRHGTINVHPSLLPKLRGASPIRTAILEDKKNEVGISIMLLDEEMDHGPLLAQVPSSITDEQWPINGPELDAELGALGGTLLKETIPLWLSGSITPCEQDHTAATYTTRFQKQNAELMVDPLQLPEGAAAYQALRTIRAFAGVGDAFFIDRGRRIKIKEAAVKDGRLILTRIVPEGKKEQSYTDYLRTRT